jgi:hypothetical protein
VHAAQLAARWWVTNDACPRAAVPTSGARRRGSVGAARVVIGRSGGEPGQFRLPLFLAVDVCDALWVSDTHNNRLQVWTAVGTFAR